MIASAVGLISLSGFAPNGLKAILQARYATMKVAIAAHDRQAVGAMLVPGFESVDLLGQSQTAAQMLDELSKIKPDPNRVSTTTLMNVTQRSDLAFVAQRYDMKTRREEPDGSQHKVELVALSSDTWVKSRKVWLLKRTVTNEFTQYVDEVVTAHRSRM